MGFLKFQIDEDHAMNKFKSLLVATTLITFQSLAQGNENSFDVLGSVMDTSKQEINAKKTIDATKTGFKESKYNKLYQDGYWQFFQASSSAKKGEYCAAMFLRQGMSVTIMGPGGSYKGALMMLSNASDNPAFPSSPTPTKVLMTLKQGSDPAATVNVLNYTIGDLKAPVAVFAVPTIEAAMAGMDDKADFHLEHKGQKILDLEWRGGHAARDELKKCLAGQAFNTKNPWKE
jgi:hypothetical protein